MSFAELRSEVLLRDLCTGCGACALACPKQVIHFHRDLVRPVDDVDPDACLGCNECVEVCPGSDPQTDESEYALFGRLRTAEERWLGIAIEARAARSRLAEVEQASASGGAVSTLLLGSMEFLGVQSVLTMGRDPDEGWRVRPDVVTDAEGVRRNAQSSYQLAPYLSALRRVYEESPEHRVAIVGLACHMQSIRRLQRRPTPLGTWAREHIVFLIETACSSNTLPAGTRRILSESMGVAPESVADVRFRAGQYPGRFEATLHDGTRRGVEFWQILPILKQSKTHRCLTCSDWMSGLADVSVCDGDPSIFESSLHGPRTTKHGRVMVRTPSGRDLMDACVSAGILETWATELDGFNLGLERKRSRRRHYERQAGVALPKSSQARDSFDDADLLDDDQLIDPDTYRRKECRS